MRPVHLPGAVDTLDRRVGELELRLHSNFLPGALRSAHLATVPETYLRTLRRDLVLTLLGVFALYLFFLMSGFEIEIAAISSSGLLLWILLLLFVVPGQYATRLYYPVILAHGRKTRIDLDLPYAISYMQALSTTMLPFDMIRRVYEEAAMFGEVSREFGMIVRDVELFGDDLITAIRSLQLITPSPVFRDFLNDLGIVFESGGDVTAYLAAKTEFFREQAKRELELVLKTIEIMAEVYVVAFVAGPIAIIIIIVAQGMTARSTLAWLQPMLFIFIPAGAIIMIWLLSTMLPPENLEITRKEVIDHTFWSDVAEAPEESVRGTGSADGDFIRKIEAQRNWHQLLQRIQNPLRTYITSYHYSIVAGIAISVTVLLLSRTGLFNALFPHNALEAVFCLVVIGFMSPVALAYEGRRWYVQGVESHLPEFLRELADMKDIGMTLQESIRRISRARLGLLSSELSVVSRDIKTGASITSALVRMEERIGLVSVKRVISLLVRASEITTNLRQIFMIAITDFEYYLRLKKERANTTIVYVMIIYLSFGIYLYTAYQLNVPFLASFRVQNLAMIMDSVGNITDMFRLGIILGAFSGIMAGQFSSNSILAGFKHSIVLLAAAVVVFVFII